MTAIAAPSKVRNVTGRPLENCGACIDGWVELSGSTIIGGISYNRGMAPCKWCELGVKRYIHATDQRHWEPLSQFDGTDITPPGEPGRKFSPTPEWLRERVAAGIPIGALQAVIPRKLWPAEWPQASSIIESVEDGQETV